MTVQFSSVQRPHKIVLRAHRPARASKCRFSVYMKLVYNSHWMSECAIEENSTWQKQKMWSYLCYKC